MIYIVGHGLIYYSVIIGALTRYQGRFFAWIAVFAVGIVPVLRGSVGTDTQAYEQMLVRLSDLGAWEGREPGFAFLAWLIGSIPVSPEVGVRLIAVLFVLGLLRYLQRADHDEIFFLLTYFMPVFFYQYSMNMIRMGLATVLLLFMVQAFRRDDQRSALIVGGFSLLFHYSALFPFLFVMLFCGKFSISKAKIFVGSTFVLAVSAFLLFYNMEYFLIKIESYKLFESPAWYSGLRIIAVVIVLLVGVCLSKLPRKYKKRLIFLGFFCLFFFWFLAWISYAGLRLLDLLWLAFPLVIMGLHGQLGIALNGRDKSIFLFAGVLGAGAIYLGFMKGAGLGPSPFLPYHWFWQG